MPGVAPAAVVEQVAGALHERLYFGLRGLRTEGARRQSKGQQQYPEFSHTHIFTKYGQIYEFLPIRTLPKERNLPPGYC